MDYCQQTTMLNYATGCQLPATQSSMQSNQFAPHNRTHSHTHPHTHTHTLSQTRVCYRDWSVFMLTRIPRRKCENETEQESIRIWAWRGWAAASKAGDMLHATCHAHRQQQHAASICAMFALATRVFCMSDENFCRTFRLLLPQKYTRCKFAWQLFWPSLTHLFLPHPPPPPACHVCCSFRLRRKKSSSCHNVTQLHLQLETSVSSVQRARVSHFTFTTCHQHSSLRKVDKEFMKYIKQQQRRERERERERQRHGR